MASEPVPPGNRAAAALLDRIASLLAVKGDNPFRVRAYQEAAVHLRNLPTSVADLWREDRLQEIPGVGPSIAAKLAEFLRSGHSTYLAELERSVPRGTEQLAEIPGLGPVRARYLAEQLNVHSPEQLIEAARAHRVRALRGFGARSEEQLLIEAQRWAQRERRLLLGVAWPIAERLVDQLRHEPVFTKVSCAGSLRRMRETVGDLDLLAASPQPPEATARFTQLPDVAEVLAHGPTKVSVLLHDGLQVDLRVVEPAAWGAALQHFTGSKQHNISLRELGIGRGLRLNEYGVFEEPSGRRCGGEREIDVYLALGLEWIPPEIREDRGEIQAAREGRLPVLVERSDLRGDLHSHTDWSDGTASVETMARAARDAGLGYLAITDHSPGLTIAHGLTPQRFRAQGHVIDALNRRLAPFRVLRGAEVDILPDGSLDLPDEILAELNFVGVSVHQAFRMDREAMTARVLKAIRHPMVDTLNHPTGRLIGRRSGYPIDLEVVLREAASLGVAVEINGQIDRLDLDDVWSRRAKDLGCRLAIDSDAHAPSGFDNLRYGVAVGRRGWLTSDDVINTLPWAEFATWLNQRKRRHAA
jgi:DNA polymerase (family 10)